MCGRYTLTATPEQLAELLGLDQVPDFEARFNVAPTQPVAALRVLVQGEGRQLDLLRWGLVPFWAKDAKIGNKMINARAETVADKPAFRAAFKRRRCLVLADGFYEWRRTPEGKQPYYITLEDGGPFAFAGLWERWDKGEGEPLLTCTLITTTPNALMQQVHHRMPVILSPGDYDLWLDPAVQDRERLLPLLRPFPAERMLAVPVSTLVNSPRNDLPECQEPVGPPLEP